jgi:hypothetical protein
MIDRGPGNKPACQQETNRVIRLRPLAALVAAFSLAKQAAAQDRVTTTSDAGVVPAGVLRVRVAPAWTRWDRVYGASGRNGVVPFGSVFSADSLGAAHISQLTGVEAAVRELAATPALQLSAGRLVTGASARIAQVPYIAEYGVSDRLMLSVLVPYVEARGVVSPNLNPRGDSSANIGLNPSGFFGSTAARSTNSGVAGGLRTGGNQLGTQLAGCIQNPNGAGCPALLARRTEAEALIASINTFTTAATALYGVSEDEPGMSFVPIAGTSAQTAVDTRLTALRTSLTSFGVTSGAGAFVAAGGPAAYAQLQQLLQDPAFGIGRDSAGIANQQTIGDIEIGATYQLRNTFTDSVSIPRDSTTRRYRAVVQALVRLGTGRPARPNFLFDVGTGDGQMDIEARGVLDMMHGKRWLTTFSAEYVAQLGSVEVERPVGVGLSPFPLGGAIPGTMTLGDIIGVDVIPRYSLTRQLFFTAAYAFRFRGADQFTAAPSLSSFLVPIDQPTSSMEHRVGIGVSYSSVGYRRPGVRGIPVELTYSHLQTVFASGGPTPKTFREQLEMRVYFGSRR